MDAASKYTDEAVNTVNTKVDGGYQLAVGVLAADAAAVSGSEDMAGFAEHQFATADEMFGKEYQSQVGERVLNSMSAETFEEAPSYVGDSLLLGAEALPAVAVVKKSGKAVNKAQEALGNLTDAARQLVRDNRAATATGKADELVGGLSNRTKEVSEPRLVGETGGGATNDNVVRPEVFESEESLVRVDSVSSRAKGTPEYDLLNNPPAKTRVILDNGTTFKAGEGGYVDEITYKPVDSAGARDARQTAVGKEGIEGDVGGHLQACRHGGTCDRFNLFPQNSNFNNSAYKKWENEITRSLKNGGEVRDVTIRLNRANPHNPRPDSLEVEYTIDGVKKVKEFENKPGG